MSKITLPQPRFWIDGEPAGGKVLTDREPSGGRGVAMFTAEDMAAALLKEREACAQRVRDAGPKEGPLKLVSDGFAAAALGDSATGS